MNAVIQSLSGKLIALFVFALAAQFCTQSASAQIHGDTALVLRLESQPILDDQVTPALNRAQHWRNRLRALGLRSEVGGVESINASISAYDIVVIPGASRGLNAYETELLSDYVASGGSIILTETAGRSIMDQTRFESLASRLGLRFRDDLFDETNSWLVVMDRPSILSATIARMQNFGVQTSRPVFIDSAVESVAFWLDHRVSPPDYHESSKLTAITNGVYGRGRFFWMGFPIDGVGGDLETSEAFFRLLGNLADFFGGMPIAEIAPWPAPYKVAAFFSMDVEAQFGNIRSVFELQDLPPFTHFLLTNQGELYADILAQIAASQRSDQEIAVHGDNHDVFRGQLPAVQHERFSRASEMISRVVGIPPQGFRPPEERYDYFTIESLVRNGYSYMLADSSPRAPVPRIGREWAQPTILRRGNDVLVQLNIHNKDDVKILTGNDFPTPDFAFQEYVKDFENIRLREGLYAANTHSHLLASERYIGVFQRLIDHVRSFDPWFANGRQICKWWRQRDRVLLTHFRRDHHNVIFGVENNSGEEIRGLTVDIWMPYAPVSAIVDVRPEMMNSDLAFDLEGNRLRLFLDDLETDAVREYHVSWHGLE